MKTDDLIGALAGDLRPTQSAPRWLAIGIGTGAALSAVLLALTLGLRADFTPALGRATIWMKWAYTGATGIAALIALRQLARPETARPAHGWTLVLPFAAIAAVALIELMRMPADQARTAWMGHSNGHCGAAIVLLSIPIFAGCAGRCATSRRPGCG